MNIKQYLQAKNSTAELSMREVILQEIKDVKKVECLHAILCCCSELLNKLPARYQDRQIEIDIINHPSYDYHYFKVCLLGEAHGREVRIPPLEEHMNRYFHESLMEALYDRHPISVAFNPQGVEELKRSLMGEELFNEYMKEKLDLELAQKPAAPRHKL